VDEDGSEVTVTLPERNLLLGGEPGAGKSNVLQLLVAVGALDPLVRLTLFDPKLVELATRPLGSTATPSCIENSYGTAGCRPLVRIGNRTPAWDELQAALVVGASFSDRAQDGGSWPDGVGMPNPQPQAPTQPTRLLSRPGPAT
jgi:hypothetical protein